MAKEKEKSALLDEETDTGAEATDTESTDSEASDVKPEKTAKKVAAKPAASQGTVQDELLSDAKRTQAILAKEPKVAFLVPLSPFEKEGAYEEVYINGYRTTVKKGVMVELPRSVVNLLAEKYRIDMMAGAESRIDRDSKTEDALSA